MTVMRMDNVGIVVQDIDAAIAFFAELGLELEGRAPVEGDGVTGLRGMRVEIAMSGPVRRHVSALLHPGHSHRARPAARAASLPREYHGP